jgi:hypothetical protein
MALSHSTRQQLFDPALEYVTGSGIVPTDLEDLREEQRLRQRNAAFSRALEVVPGGSETAATIEGLLSGSRAAVPELARARTPGELKAVAHEIASRVPMGLEMLQSRSKERELRARNAARRSALRADAVQQIEEGADARPSPRSQRALLRADAAQQVGGGPDALPSSTTRLLQLAGQGVDVPGAPSTSHVPSPEQLAAADALLRENNPGPMGPFRPFTETDEENAQAEEKYRDTLELAAWDVLIDPNNPAPPAPLVPERLIELSPDDRVLEEHEIRYMEGFSGELRARAWWIAFHEGRGESANADALRQGVPLPVPSGPPPSLERSADLAAAEALLRVNNPGPGGPFQPFIRTAEEIDQEKRQRRVAAQERLDRTDQALLLAEGEARVVREQADRDTDQALKYVAIDERTARERFMIDTLRTMTPDLTETQFEELVAEVLPDVTIPLVIPERLIQLYSELGPNRTYTDDELRYIDFFSDEDQQRALFISMAERRGRDSDRELAKALRRGALLPANEAENPFLYGLAAAATGMDRAHQATLGFFTADNPIASIDQAFQRLTGEARFSGEDLGFIRFLPDRYRGVAGRLGEEALNPFNVLVATRGLAIAAQLTKLGRGGAIAAKAFTPILTEGHWATKLAVESGFSAAIESAADAAGDAAKDMGWSREEQAVVRIIARGVAALLAMAGAKGAKLAVSNASSIDEAALATAIDAGEAGLIAGILSAPEEARRLDEGR